jgi:hypothetical protein
MSLPKIARECLDYIRAECRHQQRIRASAPVSVAKLLAALPEGVTEADLAEQCMAWVHGRRCTDGLRNAPVARLVRAGLLELVEIPRDRGPAIRLYRPTGDTHVAD